MKHRTLAAALSAVILAGVSTVWALTATDRSNPPATSAFSGGNYREEEPVEQAPMPGYENFGISYDAEGNMRFEGRLVRYFCDGYGQDGWEAVRYEYLNEEGVVDVRTVRSVIDNGDGSVDPFGELLGIEADSDEAFARRDIQALKGSPQAVTAVSGFSCGDPGVTFAERFTSYAAFDIEFRESPDGGGIGSVYYRGQLVNRFSDTAPDCGVFVYHSDGGGEINVQTVYDERGELSGITLVE